jgi:1-acyl-sn-glycerol-3-phosphate acyltransferase
LNSITSKEPTTNETVLNKIVYFLQSTVLYLVLSITVIVIGSLTPLLALIPFKIAAPVILVWCRVMIFVAATVCGIRVRLSGNLKHMPQPCVVVCNHQCFWETIYLQLFLYPLSTILKKSLLRVPFFGWGLGVLRPIAIDRSTPIQALKQIKEKGVERLQEGRNILIFPEGTRNPVGRLGIYTRSAADIAKSANVPIIAMAHNGGKYWINKKYNKRSGIVHMVISEPIVVGDKNTKEVMTSIQNWTQYQLDKME